jgi:hypothetical protein
MRRLTLFSAALLFLAGLLTAPAFCQEANSSQSTSVSVTRDDDREVHRWRTSTGLTDFNVEFRGTIVVTDDDKDIKSISGDGFLEISKTVFGSKRRIVIEPIGDGKLRREYYEGRSQVNWDPAGKNWLAEILPDIVHRSTLGAEGRVDRFYNKGGAQGVMNEIKSIESDYVKAHYAKLLLKKNISNSELPSIITTLGDVIDSDYYLAGVLQSNISKMMATKESTDAFFQAAKNINSDYYKSNVLKEALKKTTASPEQVRTVLQAAGSITSDYYLASVLTSLLEQGSAKDEILSDMVQTAKNISSDYYRTQVLNKVLAKPGISKTLSRSVVEALVEVNSDYYKTNVFNSLAEQPMDEETQLYLIQLIDRSVDSDYYASGSLRKILANQKLSDAAYKQLLTTASNINSDYYASEVLSDAAKKATTKEHLLVICNNAANIDSDHYLTSVLMAVAPQVRTSDNDVKDAYRRAAKNISSETYYGRAVRAIE